MSTTAPAAAEPTAAGPTATEPRASRLHRAAPLLGMWATILVGALVPVLRNGRFYFWDDTEAAASGVWQRIPTELLDGNVPLLQLDMWRGGNLAAEAATGMWNPVMVGLMALVQGIDDFAVAMTVAKVALMLIGGTGVYLLARTYRAGVWQAAIAGAALPLSGWSLFVDGPAWINGVAVSALTPWAWWAIRRAYLHHFRAGSVVVAVVAGYLLVSTGNPYSLLIMSVVFVALLADAVADHRVRAVLPGLLIGIAILLSALLVYLPFLGTSSVGFRADSQIVNDEFLSTNLSHLLGLSSPSLHPWLPAWNGPISVPAVYLAWFVLPLLPWLRWRRFHVRDVAGLVAFGVVLLALVIGPSQFLMFRWPARLLPFLFLAVIVLFAVALTGGIARDHVRRRAGWSAAAIVTGAWLAYSDHPEYWKWHGLSTLLIIVLTIAVLTIGRTGARQLGVLAVGTVVLIGTQVGLAPSFSNVTHYEFPLSKSETAERFEQYEGTVVPIVRFDAGDDFAPDAAWQDLLMGNMYAAVGVDSVTAYTGVGFLAFDDPLCISYNGGLCPDAWYEMWRTPDDADSPLADLLRAETVVLHDEAGRHQTPEGWEVDDRTEHATVYTRSEPLPWPDATLSEVGDGLEVSSAELDGDRKESVTFSSTTGTERTLTFARLAWPGYSASVGDRDLEVSTSSRGLLQVTVPEDVESGDIELTFMPPGFTVGLAGLVASVLLTTGFVLLRRRRADGLLAS